MAAVPLLETRHPTKSFRGRNIVNDLNIKVMKGDVYGFLGRNGQGKTTTIRLMTGLVFPDSIIENTFMGAMNESVQE